MDILIIDIIDIINIININKIYIEVKYSDTTEYTNIFKD
jgi:hypothetical protein